MSVTVVLSGMHRPTKGGFTQQNVLTLFVDSHQLYLVCAYVVLSLPSPRTIVDEGLPKQLLIF